MKPVIEQILAQTFVKIYEIQISGESHKIYC